MTSPCICIPFCVFSVIMNGCHLYNILRNDLQICHPTSCWLFFHQTRSRPFFWKLCSVLINVSLHWRININVRDERDDDYLRRILSKNMSDPMHFFSSRFEFSQIPKNPYVCPGNSFWLFGSHGLSWIWSGPLGQLKTFCPGRDCIHGKSKPKPAPVTLANGPSSRPSLDFVSPDHFHTHVYCNLKPLISVIQVCISNAFLAEKRAPKQSVGQTREENRFSTFKQHNATMYKSETSSAKALPFRCPMVEGTTNPLDLSYVLVKIDLWCLGSLELERTDLSSSSLHWKLLLPSFLITSGIC